MSDIGSYLETQFSLAGKTALLTGGAGGIGQALAAGLCGAGAQTAVCDVNIGAGRGDRGGVDGQRPSRPRRSSWT